MSKGNGISEAASEKRKRGRPAAFDPDGMRMFRRLYPEIKTKRGLQDKVCQVRAIRLLGKGADPSFFWLFCPKTNTVRASILAELGRIEDDEALRVFATQVCESKPKTKDASAIIRRWRLGREPRAEANDLKEAIIATVCDYLKRHPSTVKGHVLNSLWAARTCFKTSFSLHERSPA
jgi:hypothetical protein